MKKGKHLPEAKRTLLGMLDVSPAPATSCIFWVVVYISVHAVREHSSEAQPASQARSESKLQHSRG